MVAERYKNNKTAALFAELLIPIVNFFQTIGRQSYAQRLFLSLRRHIQSNPPTFYHLKPKLNLIRILYDHQNNDILSTRLGFSYGGFYEDITRYSNFLILCVITDRLITAFWTFGWMILFFTKVYGDRLWHH